MSNPREVTVGMMTYRKVGIEWCAVYEDGMPLLPTAASRWGFLDALLAMQSERDEARGLAFDLFNQACRVGDKYDDMALSAYEDAQAALIEWGVIKAEQCRRTTT